MKIINKENFEIGVNKSGIWYWKPVWCGANSHFFKVENGRGFKYLNCWAFFVQTTIQLFWMKWIFYISIKPKRISGEQPMRYVKYEDTHLELMDIPQGNWYDK